MKCRAIIQARMLSRRLRGKSLMSVSGTPLLGWVINRVAKMPFIDDVVVATSELAADDPICAYVEALGVRIVRGDAEDVLGRFRLACHDLDSCDNVARFTADNPLYDRDRSEHAYNEHVNSNADYTHIDGLSHMVPEFLRVKCLRAVDELATEIHFREHVTSFIRSEPNAFIINSLPSDFASLRPEYDRQLTIDRQDQLEAFEEMVSAVSTNQEPTNLSLDLCYEWLDSKHSVRPLKEGNIRIKLAGREVGDGCPCFVIAEIGQNHNGQLNLAKRLIDMAARCKADAVKFQKRDIACELTPDAYQHPYEGPNSFGRTYGEHREYLELNESQHRVLKDYAQQCGLIYFCTPCDAPSVDILERLNTPFYKVASRDMTNIPLLRRIALTGKPVILSTGMSTLEEISEAIRVFNSSRCDIALLQCVSEYPSKPENVNLNAMATMRKEFGVLVGLSDHTTGVITSVAAANLNAFAVEKHITLSRAMNGTDHSAALEEEGLRRLVAYIRTCELAMGDGVKAFNPVAASAKQKLARSLVSKTEIPKGTVLTEGMIELRSPGTGLSWRDRSCVVGRISNRHIRIGELLTVEMFT